MKISTIRGQKVLLLNHGRTQINVNTIRYIEGDGNYSHIKLVQNQVHTSSFTLKVFTEELIENKVFFSPRKGLLLNLNYLKEVFYNMGVLHAKLHSGEVLPLSRRRGKALLDHLWKQKFHRPSNSQRVSYYLK